MAGPKQSKRVSWAPDLKLCEVRLFLSEDAPSQSGLGAQDHLQAKPAWLLHAAGMGGDDSLPPGFEAPHSYQYKVDLSQVPLVQWQCPPRLVLNPEWQVVGGEESEEVVIQNQRQLGVLEAVYPRSSSIPPNPSVSPEVQEASVSNDAYTPLIPITAVEDDDSSDQSDTVAPSDTSSQVQCLDVLNKRVLDVGTPQPILPDLRFAAEKSQCYAVPIIPNLPQAEQPLAVGAPPGVEPDVVAAASAAFVAIMRSCEEGSLIDRDLLIKFLSNPSLIEKLVSEYGGSLKQNPQHPPLAPPASTPSLPLPPPLEGGIKVPLAAPLTSHVYNLPSVAVAPSLNPQPPPPVSQITTNPLRKVPPPPVKDLSYYKSLIQQHGGEQQNLDPKMVQVGGHHDYQSSMIGTSNGGETVGHGLKQRDPSKPKIQKPCVYFNTPRGCRNGASCLYQHDGSLSQRIEQPKGAKRIKLDTDRGIAGRN